MKNNRQWKTTRKHVKNRKKKKNQLLLPTEEDKIRMRKSEVNNIREQENRREKIEDREKTDKERNEGK